MSDAVELVVPALDPEGEQWPTLGPFVCRFIEENLVHGPGDVRGHPAELTREFRRFIWRAYEVHPPRHAQAGRRRFKRCVLSRRKGAAKTELLAWIAIGELDPNGPVRFREWHRVNDKRGRALSELSRFCLEHGFKHGDLVPIPRAVRDPYIPLIATTEKQSDELAYAAAKEILLECALGNAYDVGEEKITHRSEPGVMQSLAGAPNARDGARTTFQGFDETHLYAERLRRAHATMQRNLTKRMQSDPWGMETTTMFEPGEGTIAETAYDFALDIHEGRVKSETFFFDHRQAAFVHDLSRRTQLLRAIEEAGGDAHAFADVAAIANEYLDPTKDKQAFRRYFLNQRVKGSRRWVDVDAVIKPLVAPRRRARTDAQGVLAFDGSYNRDSSALVFCSIADRPHVEVVAAWERPRSDPLWRTPRGEVLAVIADTMDRLDVVEFAPDPFGWTHEIEELELEYGDVVVRFETNQPSRMAPAASMFLEGAKDKAFTVDGTDALMRHLGNCIAKPYRVGTDEFALPVKSSPDSPDKIDVAIGAIVAYARARFYMLNPPTARKRWAAV